MLLPVAQLDSWELHSICTGPVFVVWGTWHHVGLLMSGDGMPRQRKKGVPESLSDFLHMSYDCLLVIVCTLYFYNAK